MSNITGIWIYLYFFNKCDFRNSQEKVQTLDYDYAIIVHYILEEFVK
jgi:hypothetical protein